MPLEKPDTFNALCVYREIGIKLGGFESFEKSLEYFDSALRRDPHDNRALCGRAKCRAKAYKYSDALKDIATLKALDSDNIYVSSYESLVKYLCSEFEQAMVLNISKQYYRKKPDTFVMGAMHCEDAIQNNIGHRAGHPLRDHFRIIRKLAWLKTFDKSKPCQPKTKYKKKRKEWIDDKTLRQLAAPDEKKKKQGVQLKKSKDSKVFDKSETSLTGITHTVNKMFASKDNLFSEGSSIKESLHTSRDSGQNIPPLKSFPFKPIQRYTNNIHNLMAERYLGRMSFDKKFLGELHTHPGIESPNRKASTKILKLAKKSSKQIALSQELLRTRRPFYFLRFNDGKPCGKLEEQKLLKEKSTKKCFEVKSENLTKKMELAMSSRKLRQVIDTAEQIYDFCEDKSIKSLPSRNELLNNIYTTVRDAFYRTKCVKSSMSLIERRVRASIILGLPKERQESAYTLIAELECPFENKKRKCQIFEERIRKSTCREEQIWCYHELTRLYFDRKEFELSRAYATKCLRESYIMSDNKWIVNTIFMMIKNDIAIKNNNGAKMSLRRCRRVAVIIGDDELDQFIGLCLDILNEVPVEVNLSSRIIERRINRIMDLVTLESAKNEGTLIFRRISSLPARRRISVLPGVVYYNGKTAIPSDQNSDNNGEKRRRLKSAHKGRKVEENRRNRGFSFLGLIQYHKGP